MNLLVDWLGQAVVQRLGWTLLHFLWQGAAVALVYAAARAALRPHSANARYLAGCLALLLMAVAPVATFVRLGAELPEAGWTGTPPLPGFEVIKSGVPAPSGVSRTGSLSGGPLAAVATLTNAAVPWLTSLWLAGVSLLSLRLSAGWLRVRGWQHGASDTLGRELGARLSELQTRLGVSRPVRLLRSVAVRVPVVVGWFRPAILLPTSTLTGLTPQQLEFILAHELAHIRRGDAWVSLLQTLIETSLFYHPAMWWVSRCVREDREHCCDDLALAVCGDGLTGAQALATLEAHRQWSEGVALAASDGSLLGRVRRLLGVAEDRRGWPHTLGGALVGVGVAAILAGTVAFAALATPVYTAYCRLQLRPPGADSAGAPPAATGSHDPFWLTTQLEQMRSWVVLRDAALRVKLIERWKSSSDATDAPSMNEVLSRLGRCVSVRQIRNTWLVDLGVTLNDPQLASELANAIAESYRQRWPAPESQGLIALQESLDQHNARLAEQEKAVDRLRAELGAVEGASDAGWRASLERERATVMAQSLAFALGEETLHRAKLEQLRELDPAALRQTIVTVIPDEVLAKLLQDLSVAEQERATLRVEYAENHPRVCGVQALCEELDRQVTTRTAGIMSGFEQLARAHTTRREELERGLGEAKGRLSEDVQRRRELLERERQLQAQQRVRDGLALRLEQEKIDLQVAATSRATVVDTAQPPDRPSGRQGPPWAKSAWGGGLLCCVTGLGLRLLARRPLHRQLA